MKFSAGKARRKWPFRHNGSDHYPSVAVAVLGLMLLASSASAYLTDRAVPLPKPRPAEAPVTERQPSDPPAASETTAPPASQDQVEAAPQPSACRLALTEEIAIAPSIPDVNGPGACGGIDLVRLEAVVLPDKSRVAVKPAAVLRCTMASALADWIRSDMAPLAESLGSKLSDLDNFDSFDCRGRNRVRGAKMSEHGRANAIDMRGLKLANGQSISLTDRSASREVREKVLLSVCKRFTTVLGPGSDWYHEDHIHIDLAERRGGYRICQWNLWEQLPHVAPLLPAERPDAAPPRAVTEQAGPQPTARAPEPEAEPQAPAEQAPATKKRRDNRRL